MNRVQRRCPTISPYLWTPLRQAVLSLTVGWFAWIGHSPARSEFRKIPATSVESCSVRLAAAQDIPHICRLYRDAKAKLPVWDHAFGFEFGRLTYTEWQQLVSTYATWHNRQNLADYDRDRNYTLMDFMPPMIQSLNRHQFHEQDLTPLSNQARNRQQKLSKIKLAANCWGTLYEILRLAKRVNPPAPTLFVTDSHPMLTALRQRSTEIRTHTQPGDIVLIYHQHGNQAYLDHVALVVDQQLFFEKAGSGNDVPYRLVDGFTLEQIWNPEIYTFEYRRPHPQSQWQTPQQVFSQERNGLVSSSNIYGTQTPNAQKTPTSAGHVDYFAMMQLPVLISWQGRFRLPPQTYNRQRFLEQLGTVQLPRGQGNTFLNGINP